MSATDRWIEQLADSSPRIRQEALMHLADLGWRARAALTRAAESPVAQRRALARTLLSQLPLYTLDDPPQVREPLRAYQSAEPSARPPIALRLLALATPETDEAFMRILDSERDASVQWAIAATMPAADRDRLARGPMAEVDLGDSVPAYERYLIAASMASSHPGPPADAVIDQYQRVLDGLTSVPDVAVPPIAQLANALCAAARTAGDGPREIAIRRQVALLTPTVADDAANEISSALTEIDRQIATMTGEQPNIDEPPPAPPRMPPAVARYLATRLRLHDANGVRADLASMGVADDDLGAKLLLALLERTAPATAPAGAAALTPELAALVDSISETDRGALAELLLRLGADAGQWPMADLIAERALTKFDARLAAATSVRDRTIIRLARLRVALIRLAAARAQHDEAAQRAARAAAATLVVDVGDPRVSWSDYAATRIGSVIAFNLIDEVRRADREDDAAVRDAALEALARISPLNDTAALDAIYVLEMNGRVAQADEVFAERLATERALLDQQPDNPSAMNSVAWLCARSGRNLELAYDLAKRANAGPFHDPSLMDTLAEAAFRTNRVAEAVALESQALREMASILNATTENTDDFMVGQLARFRAGLKPGDAERPLPSEHWGSPSHDTDD